MELSKDEIESIIKLREVSILFCKNKISLSDFYKIIEFELGSTFDYGVDFTIEDLPDYFTDEIKNEIIFYDNYTTYDRDDENCVIPTNPKWEYGKTNEPFGWIDEQAYRKLYKVNFNKLILQKLNFKEDK